MFNENNSSLSSFLNEANYSPYLTGLFTVLEPQILPKYIKWISRLLHRQSGSSIRSEYYYAQRVVLWTEKIAISFSVSRFLVTKKIRRMTVGGSSSSKHLSPELYSCRREQNCRLAIIEVPDRTFLNYKASKSVNRRIVRSSETSTSGILRLPKL